MNGDVSLRPIEMAPRDVILLPEGPDIKVMGWFAAFGLEGKLVKGGQIYVAKKHQIRSAQITTTVNGTCHSLYTIRDAWGQTARLLFHPDRYERDYPSKGFKKPQNDKEAFFYLKTTEIPVLGILDGIRAYHKRVMAIEDGKGNYAVGYFGHELTPEAKKHKLLAAALIPCAKFRTLYRHINDVVPAVSQADRLVEKLG